MKSITLIIAFTLFNANFCPCKTKKQKNNVETKEIKIDTKKLRDEINFLKQKNKGTNTFFALSMLLDKNQKNNKKK
jgi:hypothetical protein